MTDVLYIFNLARSAASLSASSGIFLGPDFRFDLVRPGAALYGIAPQADAPNPMRPVIGLRARVMQTRSVPAGNMEVILVIASNY